MKVKITSAMSGRVFEGEIPEMGLEEVFRYFNRVDEADGHRLEAIGFRQESLSVGDLVTLPGGTYEVAPVGFTRVRLAEPYDRTATRRREARRNVRTTLGTSGDRAPEARQALRAACDLAELLELATGGKYKLVIETKEHYKKPMTVLAAENRLSKHEKGW